MMKRACVAIALHRLAGVIIVGVVLVAHAVCSEQLPQPTRVTLSNGLTVVFRQNPTGQTFAIAALVRAPAGLETVRTAGIRALTVEMMINRPAGDDGIAPRERIAQLGGVVGTSVDADLLYVNAVGLTENFGKCVPAFRDIVFGSEFDWSSFDVAKSGLLHTLAVIDDDEVAYAERLANAYLFAGTSCAWPTAGTELSVARLTASQIRRFHGAYVRPGNVVVSISGPMEYEPTMALLRREFGALLPAAPVTLDDVSLPDRDAIFIHRPWAGPNAALLAVSNGPGIGHSSAAAADVLCAILGGGEGSLLWRRLRGELGIVYSVVCRRNANHQCASIEILTICNTDDVGKAYDAVGDVIAGIQAAPPSEEDLARAKAWVSGRRIFALQSNLEAAVRAGAYEAVMPGSGSEYDQQLLDGYQGVTAREVQQAALEWLSRAVWVQVNGIPPL